MQTINIMSACDEGYAKYILPQLVSIDKHLSEYNVNFFLLYNRISDKTNELIKNFCTNYPRINFQPIIVDKDIEKFSELASGGGGGQTGKSTFPYEVYFLLDCHNYLPDSVDRVLYIHSADIIFFGDVSEFYFSNFYDKALTIELSNSRIYKDAINYEPVFKDGRVVLLNEDDRPSYIKKYKIESAAFNSGTFMINVNRFRNKGYTLDYFLNIKKEIAEIHSDITDNKYYEGDQAFFTIAFLGEMTSFYSDPQKIKNYREYNYTPVSKLWRIKQNHSNTKEPKIIHYDSLIKPWQMTKNFFDSGIPNNINETTFLSELHNFRPIALQKYYKLYWDFVKETPIYDEVHKEAEYLSKVYKKTYLPSISEDIESKQLLIESNKKNNQLDKDFKHYKNKYDEMTTEFQKINSNISKINSNISKININMNKTTGMIKQIEKRQKDTFLKKIKRRLPIFKK